MDQPIHESRCDLAIREREQHCVCGARRVNAPVREKRAKGSHGLAMRDGIVVTQDEIRLADDEIGDGHGYLLVRVEQPSRGLGLRDRFPDQ